MPGCYLNPTFERVARSSPPLILFFALVTGAASSAARANNGPSPATTPPASLSGELSPLDVDVIAPERDQSGFNEFTDSPWSVARFVDLAAVDGRLVSANHWGLTTWTAEPGELPHATGSIGYFDFPYRTIGEPSQSPIKEFAVAPAPYSIAALAGAGGMSLTLVDIEGAPVVLYEDGGEGNKQGRAIAIGHTNEDAYVLLAAWPGLHAYSLGAAKEALGYVEVAPDPSSQHPGIYRGVVYDLIANITQIAVLDRKVLVADSLGSAALLEMTEVGPLTTLHTFALPEPSYRLELWRHRGRTFAAATVESGRLLIFDAAPLLAGEADDLGLALSAVELPFGHSSAGRIVAASADGIPTLYVSSGGEPAHNADAAKQPRDILLDLRDPTAPRQVAAVASETPSYLAHALQFGWVQPLSVEFVGRTLHRVAGGVYDVHAWTPPDDPPVFVGVPPETCVVGEGYQWSLVAVDPEGASVEFTAEQSPAGLTVSPAGAVVWNCTQADVGAHTVAVAAFDGTITASTEWTLTVVDAGGSTGDPSPTASDTGPVDGGEGGGSSAGEGSTGEGADAWASSTDAPANSEPGSCACRSAGVPSADIALLVLFLRRRRVPQAKAHR